ncbi:MAG: LysR family transcriptional regulator [Tropicimonas sp.]|uniref:LysR family transcriptional regulator n=1 Tax=Tropicimonas sp. TaxID=2067044 RepID=UPI003A853E18
MDLSTLHLAHEVLHHRGIRAAARATGRAPSTVSGAIARMEAAIAVQLIRREGSHFVLTLEAERRAAHFASASRAIAALLEGAGPVARRVPPVRLKALARFAIVAHCGSIRAAARQLETGQPQLARQMDDLERALGLPLLERTRHGSTLNVAGRRVLPLAENVVGEWERISHEATARFRHDVATWRIGTVLPMGHESSVARMLARFSVLWTAGRKRHRLLISGHTADELMIGLKSRRFDLVILDHGHVPQEFQSIELSTTPLALVGHESIVPEGADLRALLRAQPLALPSARSGIRQESMAFLNGLMGEREAREIGCVEVDSIPVIINLVAEHGYLSILPLDSVERLPFPLRRVSLAPAHMQRLVVVWRRVGLPEALIDAVRCAARETAPPEKTD